MIYIDAIPGSQIDIGYQGENLARTIRFDISEWRNLNGDGNGLDLSYDMVRMLVILDRAGMFD